MKARCSKTVFSGGRSDVRGHQCGNYALEDSDYCRTHDPEVQNESRWFAPASAEPSERATTTVTCRATLRWHPGEGPIAPIPYQNRSGFITNATATARDDDELVYTVAGVVVKSDGSPGNQTWKATYRSKELLPIESQLRLAELIDRQRSGLRSENEEGDDDD